MGDFWDAWLVVPSHNEAPIIGQVIEEARQIFPNVVCVDDGSTDSTAEIASHAGAYVVRHPLNLGQGAAIQTGIDYVLQNTSARFLVTFDADGQHLPEDAASMVVRARESDLGVVYGSRFLGQEAQVGRVKRVFLKTAAAVTRWKTGLSLTDAHNGLRVLRRDAATRVDLTQDRMAHASEIVGQLSRTGLPWEEYPVSIQYTDYSRAKGQSLLNSVNILVELALG